MTKKLLQQLVLASYSGKTLNAEKVNEIADKLTRVELKAYIRALKLMEMQRKVYIAMPKSSVYNTNKNNFKSIYPGKELVFEEDPSLLLGLRIVDNDMVYETSLKQTLEKIVDEVEQQFSE